LNREPPLLFRVIRPPLVLLRFVLNSGYALLFSWWLDKRLVDSSNREFAADIRKHLPFLFEQYGARILPNDREPPPSFDFALVTVVADDIVLRFFRDRGTVTVRASSTSAPDDSHELTTLLNVVDAAIKRRCFSHLLDVEPVLRSHMDDLRKAFSEGRYAYVKGQLSEVSQHDEVVRRQWEREINRRL